MTVIDEQPSVKNDPTEISKAPPKSPRRAVGIAHPPALATLILLCPAALSSSSGASTEPSGWWRWGGPDADFSSPFEPSRSWSEREPAVLWERVVGGGHSSPVIGADLVYLHHGSQGSDVVEAFDRITGATLWRQQRVSRYTAHLSRYDGPHSTPALVGDRLFVVGIDAVARAFSAGSGALLWTRDLIAEHDLALPQSGYAASPAVWRDRILLPALGRGAPGAIAL
ncbi:MAG: hypothetical protein DWQ30_06745 [Acidobacteria bacterium]|nr:MAG: hypothetical protein DWQ30_06745 [Acidobacteriota bacterium]